MCLCEWAHVLLFQGAFVPGIPGERLGGALQLGLKTQSSWCRAYNVHICAGVLLVRAKYV